jgi:hypothetical protein
MERRTGAGAMSLMHITSSIFRGHIPGHAVRADSTTAVPPVTAIGLLAGAALAIALAAASVWATIWLAIRLI